MPWYSLLCNYSDHQLERITCANCRHVRAAVGGCLVVQIPDRGAQRACCAWCRRGRLGFALMAYEALYRRYRPSRFQDAFFGQDHVVAALRNAIEGDRVGHA